MLLHYMKARRYANLLTGLKCRKTTMDAGRPAHASQKRPKRRKTTMSRLMQNQPCQKFNRNVVRL